MFYIVTTPYHGLLAGQLAIRLEDSRMILLCRSQTTFLSFLNPDVLRNEGLGLQATPKLQAPSLPY